MPITETPFYNLQTLNTIQQQPPTIGEELNKLFTCGFQLGYSDPNVNNPGATASGLMAIFNALYAYAFTDARIKADPVWTRVFSQSTDRFRFNENFYCVVDSESQRLVWVIRGLYGAETLAQNLDSLNAHIGGMIAIYDPVNSPVTASAPSNVKAANTAMFNRFKNFTFIDSYGSGSNSQNYSNIFAKGNSNYSGGGITRYFVLQDQDPDYWQLSRAGVELKTLFNYLSYGGIAVVAPTWKSLLNFKSTSIIPSNMRQEVALSATQLKYPIPSKWNGEHSIFCNNLEAVVSLEQGGLIERRYTEAGYGTTGANRVAYALQPYTYINAGVSAGLIYGLTGSELLNIHNNPNERGSFLSTFMNDDVAGGYKNIPIFHCGLSGTDIALSHSFEDIVGSFRYFGLDGHQGLRPESALPSAGLTTYQLVDDAVNGNYDGLNRLLCIVGKNYQTMSELTTNLFFGPGKNVFTMKTPAIADAVGRFAYNKLNKPSTEGGLFSSPLGVLDGDVLNGEIVPTFAFAGTLSERLHSRRINFFDYDTFGLGNAPYFLASEFTGATGPSPNAPDRFSTMWLVRTIKQDLITSLSTTFNGQVKSEVQGQIIQFATDLIQTKYSRYLEKGWVVEWPAINSTSPTIVYLTVNLKPKVVIQSYTEVSGINGFSIDFAISLD